MQEGEGNLCKTRWCSRLLVGPFKGTAGTFLKQWRCWSWCMTLSPRRCLTAAFIVNSTSLLPYFSIICGKLPSRTDSSGSQKQNQSFFDINWKSKADYVQKFLCLLILRLPTSLRLRPPSTHRMSRWNVLPREGKKGICSFTDLHIFHPLAEREDGGRRENGEALEC